jgi:hypothetical protein
MPYPFVYLNSAQTEQVVTNMVEQFKVQLRNDIQAWLGASALDNAEAVSSIVAHALSADAVDMGAIENVLTDALDAEELKLVQACYTHHVAWRHREFDSQIKGLRDHNTHLEARVQVTQTELVALQKKNKEGQASGVSGIQQHQVWDAATVNHGVWNARGMNNTPTVATLTSKIKGLESKCGENLTSIAIVEARIKTLQEHVVTLEQTHENKLPSDYRNDLKTNRALFQTLRERVTNELKVASYPIYIDALEAKLKEVASSAEVTALSGMVVNLQAFLKERQQCARLEAEYGNLVQKAKVLRRQVEQAGAFKAGIEEKLAQARQGYSQINMALDSIQQDLKDSQIKLTSYRYSAFGFASLAIVSAVAAATMGLPMMFAVAASTVALCSLIAGLVNVCRARNLSSQITRDEGNAKSLEGQKSEALETIVMHVHSMQLQEDSVERAKETANTTDAMLDATAGRLVLLAQQRDGFFAKAKEEGGELVRSFSCA